MGQMPFETAAVGNVRVHVCPTEKFKTTTIAAMIQQELTPETVTKTALLPSVLQRGTVSHPSTLQLKRKLEDLYGATLHTEVFKRGERHIMHVGLEIANGRYLSESPKLLREGVAFLMEVLTRPVVEDGGFRRAYVEAEKKNLKQKIESLLDDKIRYAAQRCIAAMCDGEPFGLFVYGRTEDLPSIDPIQLYTYYRQVIETCPIDFFFVGNVSTDDAAALVRELFPYSEGERPPVEVNREQPTVKQVKEVVDRLDVIQGKLNMGCRTGVTIRDDDYVPLLMYNGILGGFPHSKLFMNVREKASLAYYASSRLESHKGILTIQSGIEIANYQKALDIIRKQLEAMRRGEITDRELSQTRATLSNQLRERQDRPYELIDFAYHSLLSGREWSLDQLLKGIESVDKEDVRRVAEQVQLDTIYFLRDKGGKSDGAH